MSYIITSYYTLDTGYAQVCHDYLMPSLYKLKLLSDIRGIQSLGSWQANTSYKPTFIKEMMIKHKDKNIVLIDSDATVNTYPVLFDEIPEDINIAAHVLDREKWYSKSYPEGFKTELLSGTLFIRNCKESLELLDEWEQRCISTKQWEQKILQQIIQEQKITLYNLPISYTWIESLPNGSKPFVQCEFPVISHFQKSRELKNTIH